jgi:hypothetical protein
MARIKIEDLPASRDLTPEELLELFGAGPRRFLPGLEQLEDRRLMSADPTSLLRLVADPDVPGRTAPAGRG